MHAEMKKRRERGIHLIAELANVSIGTVDRALHGRAGINESTRQRILQIARQIAYTPNLAARALSVSKPAPALECASRGKSIFSTINSGAECWMKRAAWRSLASSLNTARFERLGEEDTEAFKELLKDRR